MLTIAKVRRRFPRPRIDDVRVAVAEQMEAMRERIRPGESIAITVGSRGIANLATIAHTMVEQLKGWGAAPFIIPAMGSHGGGTAEGQLEVLAQDLKQVREEWQARQQEFQTQQEALQGQWRELGLKVAELKGELAYLDDDAQREVLAMKRAIHYVLDNLKEPVPCPGDLRPGLEAMIELNIKTDAYQEGLGTVGGLIALLDSMGKGMDSFQESVGGLIGEQRMHSEFLPRLQVRLPDSVIAFHNQWDGLRARMHDDARLCAHPTEFLEAARPVIERDLSDEAINNMFNRLGQALTEATKKWRG